MRIHKRKVNLLLTLFLTRLLLITLLKTLIKDSNFAGIQGFVSHIDENGDAEGNYTLLSRQPYVTNLSDYSMRPVGHFEIDKNYNGLPVRLDIFHEINGM